VSIAPAASAPSDREGTTFHGVAFDASPLPLEQDLPPSVVGQKAARLRQIGSLGLRVPKAYVLPADVSHRSVNDLRAELAICWHKLRAPLVVRSSAVHEDGAVLSFAGQYESVLNLNSLSALEVAAELTLTATTRFLAYRRRTGAPSQGLALIVQEQAPVTRAGVLITADPIVTGTMRIECARGLGTGIVDGATPDEAMQLSSSDSPSALPRALLKRLANAGETLRRHFGCELEIEWGIDERQDELFLFQARPTPTARIRRELPDGVTAGATLAGGVGASPGRALGRVHVLSSGEPPVLRRHSVIVANHLDADAVRFFGQISALVVGEGGRLSHLAMLARESGLPMVVQVGDLKTLRHGLLIVVDGTAGVIARAEVRRGRG
jgi:pyruvate, water dikinase